MPEPSDWGTSVIIDLSVDSGPWPDAALLEKLVRRCCTAISGELEIEVGAEAELSVVFTDDTRMRGLNSDWRNQDKPTNVLSFPASEPGNGPLGPLLGDIAIAQETVLREAETLGIPFDHHLSHLIVHGILHLFGYDHISEEDAVEMEAAETHILARMDIPDPYDVAYV